MTFERLTSSAPGRRSGVSVWRQIADTLTTEIHDRAYADTGRLPGEIELAERFSVNRHTLRQAVAALQHEGLVRIEPGRGTFVQHELVDYALSRRTRFSENLLRQGLLPSKQLLTARELPAPPRATRELRLPKGASVLMVEMLDEANDEPIGLATSYYPAQRFAGLLEMLNEGTCTTDILRHFGVQDYLRAQSRITTQMPGDETARLLKQPATRPMLCVECVDVDMDGTPIKYGETIFCGDRVQLVVSAGDEA
ncbi:MAG: phosphonate metabolism transcriptional regulator PhnF [Gammaproteobacteria bacterium]|nr:phosphonate metabolism transcriptional regulator PhnF [Gammaproteobacteria bacterium]MBU0788221.1 phosphonate metabolism transcriptional regulator PhnF [Gammaproteobacteria bacterium]MBU0815282.1 phosphonate metabolism transcriptional regulator PhnF [Gammaproteobacteria bacterium]MBU1785610.1 phosphonate metabolism transcriptional regulator PhnF [Gammaproteobacteria bacterium]